MITKLINYLLSIFILLISNLIVYDFHSAAGAIIYAYYVHKDSQSANKLDKSGNKLLNT